MTGNTINLGPRARRIVRLAARFVNPLVLLIAGRRWINEYLRLRRVPEAVRPTTH